mmetsp:Transcript_49849/g.98246  ORF Transcript_49849/g.98246 Transcript_49849/m.98246 type:complete len:305 (-) Transcript_49849:52-966(-)
MLVVSQLQNPKLTKKRIRIPLGSLRTEQHRLPLGCNVVRFLSPPLDVHCHALEKSPHVLRDYHRQLEETVVIRHLRSLKSRKENNESDQERCRNSWVANVIEVERLPQDLCVIVKPTECVAHSGNLDTRFFDSCVNKIFFVLFVSLLCSLIHLQKPWVERHRLPPPSLEEHYLAHRFDLRDRGAKNCFDALSRLCEKLCVSPPRPVGDVLQDKDRWLKRPEHSFKVPRVIEETLSRLRHAQLSQVCLRTSLWPDPFAQLKEKVHEIVVVSVTVAYPHDTDGRPGVSVYIRHREHVGELRKGKAF